MLVNNDQKINTQSVKSLLNKSYQLLTKNGSKINFT